MDYMCIEAVKNALPRLPYDIADVDLVVFSSYTPSDTVATTAHVVQREFRIEKAKAIFVAAACSSAINALEIIQLFFDGGRASKALLLSADRNTTYFNEHDPKAGHLWGDAAAAFFFSKEKVKDGEAKILDIETQGLGHVGLGRDGVYLNLRTEGIVMNGGKDVFMQACIYIAKGAREIVQRNGYTIADLSYFIGHQANARIVNHVVNELGMLPEKSLSNIEELGNTGSVSSLLALAQNYPRFKKDDLICISVFGGGYSAGACLIKF